MADPLATTAPLRRLVQLVLGCAVLGLGIGLLLNARLGADGYTMLVSGTNISSGVAFWICNVVVGVVLVLLAWARGQRPGSAPSPSPSSSG